MKTIMTMLAVALLNLSAFAQTAPKISAAGEWQCAGACASVDIPGGATVVGGTAVKGINHKSKSNGASWENKSCSGFGKSAYDAAVNLQKAFQSKVSSPCAGCSANGAMCRSSTEEKTYSAALNPAETSGAAGTAPAGK